MDGIWRDPELRGVYVKRCKCGKRPQYDRVDPCMPSYGCWITCICGKEGLSGSSKTEAIDNWNDGKLIYGHNYNSETFKMNYPKKWDKEKS